MTALLGTSFRGDGTAACRAYLLSGGQRCSAPQVWEYSISIPILAALKIDSASLWSPTTHRWGVETTGASTSPTVRGGSVRILPRCYSEPSRRGVSAFY